MATYAAYIYVIFMLAIVIFQFCLTIGVPWGAASMGGKFPGKYPPKMRLISFSNMIILSFMAIIVLVRAELILPQLISASLIAIWFVVVFSIIATILNIITKSKIERNIWAPVTAIQLICVLIIVYN